MLVECKECNTFLTKCNNPNAFCGFRDRRGSDFRELTDEKRKVEPDDDITTMTACLVTFNPFKEEK